MISREFGKTGWIVPGVGLGLWNIGNQWGTMDDATAEAIIREAVEQGMTLLDVAESYGDPNGMSELRLGRVLPSIRDRVLVVSKIGHWGVRSGQIVPKTTPDMIRLCGHACCGRLQTDRVDLMLCHDGNIENPHIYIEGFEQLKAEGFIRAYGISTDNLDALRRFVEASRGGCAAVEVDYSLINRVPEAEFLPYCRGQGLGVIVRGPLARGVLGGRFTVDTVFTDSVRREWSPGGKDRATFEAMLAQAQAIRSRLPAGMDLPTAAVRYTLGHPAVSVVIPGATSLAQVRANARAGAALLTEAERAALADSRLAV
jgi:myo-inositol catabolism protein IolS